jgi:peptidoglycan/xylan/chitin deacetylase (PgdA/CDA1 family)
MRATLAIACSAALAVLAGCGGSPAPARGASVAATSPAAVPATSRTTAAPQAPAMPGAHLAPHEAVPILMYHVIGYVKPDTALPALWVSPSEFSAEVRALKDGGFHGVTLRQLWDAWHHGARLPSKPIVFSFDDGYEGQVRNALPTLRRQGWPGVLNLKLDNLPDLGGSRGVKRMVQAGWEIDSHTITHPDLTTVGDQQLRHELVASRSRIKRLFGRGQAAFFCYPSGRFDSHVIEAVRAAGYLAATTVQPGFAKPSADPYELARVRVDGGTGAPALMQKIRALRTAPSVTGDGASGGE